MVKEQAEQASGLLSLDQLIEKSSSFLDYRVHTEAAVAQFVQDHQSYFKKLIANAVTKLDYGSDPEIRRSHLRISQSDDFLDAVLNGKFDPDTGLRLDSIFQDTIDAVMLKYAIGEQNPQRRVDAEQALVSDLNVMASGGKALPGPVINRLSHYITNYNQFEQLNKEEREALDRSPQPASSAARAQK